MTGIELRNKKESKIKIHKEIGSFTNRRTSKHANVTKIIKPNCGLIAIVATAGIILKTLNGKGFFKNKKNENSEKKIKLISFVGPITDINKYGLKAIVARAQETAFGENVLKTEQQ
jgi:hypothetical protein